MDGKSAQDFCEEFTSIGKEDVMSTTREYGYEEVRGSTEERDREWTRYV